MLPFKNDIDHNSHSLINFVDLIHLGCLAMQFLQKQDS